MHGKHSNCCLLNSGHSFCVSTSKSSTNNLVSSVPLRLPTAHTSLVWLARTRQTTPPLPPLSKVTRLRMNSPVCRSHSLTVPSSELVMTNFLLNWRQVTALWCLFGPEVKCCGILLTTKSNSFHPPCYLCTSNKYNGVTFLVVAYLLQPSSSA